MAESLKVCETCPWLTKNHGKPHPAKWYSLANLKRLWNGLRTGKAPGMVCHSSDKDQVEYGGTAKIKDGVEKRHCAGAVIAFGKHINRLNAAGSYEAYRAGNVLPLTKRTVVLFAGEQVFGQKPFPDVEDRSADISFPRDK